jgi:flagellar protein FlgJ
MAMNLPAIQAQSASQNQALERLRADAAPSDRQGMKKAAEDFESLFLNIVLKAMRDTVPKSALIDGGNAEEIYKGMLDEEYAKMMAQQRHTGLADNIEAFMLQAQAGIKASLPAGKDLALKAYQNQGLQVGQKQARMNDGSSPGPGDIVPSTRKIP